MESMAERTPPIISIDACPVSAAPASVHLNEAAPERLSEFGRAQATPDENHAGDVLLLIPRLSRIWAHHHMNALKHDFSLRASI